jgi:hypothetical protein
VIRALLVSALLVVVSCADDTDRALPTEVAVVVEVSGCRNLLEYGGGSFIAPGQVLTSAHVVAGASEIVVWNADGRWPAQVAAFDPELDLAVLNIDGLPQPYVTLPETPSVVSRGTAGVVVLRRDDRLISIPVELVRRVEILTEDIYREGETRRPGYEVRSEIRPGDSGAVVMVNGSPVAVLWSRSRNEDTRAWAIDPVRGGELITAQLSAESPRVDNGRCRS